MSLRNRTKDEKILILDNYDSFTYNLVHLVEKITGTEVSVFRNDKISLDEINQYDKIILSPGPGLPENAGIMPALIKTYASAKSILGVCLGHQAIAESFGGSLLNLKTVFHGVRTPVQILEPDPLFKGIPAAFTIGRYHSWVVNKSTLPSDLRITAIDEQGNIMALSHNMFNVKGVQFHPESILTEYGEALLENWLKM